MNLKKIQTSYGKFEHIVSEIMITLCVAIFLLMVFAVSYGVLGRYLPFVKSPRWTQELAVLCLIWLCFVSAGYAIQKDKHVRMTILVNAFPKKVQKGFLYGAYAILLAISLFWIIYGFKLALLTGKARMAATGWPMSLNYYSLVVGGIYGVIVSLGRIIKGGEKDE